MSVALHQHHGGEAGGPDEGRGPGRPHPVAAFLLSTLSVGLEVGGAVGLFLLSALVLQAFGVC